jgi:ParB family chromosome partitioning protein
MAKRKGAKGARAATGRGRRADSRKRLVPRKERRGLAPEQTLLAPSAQELASLVQKLDSVGGAVIGAYREPLGGKPLLVAEIPVDALDPTPYQRDLSPTHAKRLAQKIEETGAFLDPLIVVQGVDGRLWTPNGRHRLAAAKLLGLRCVTALCSLDPKLAYKILALNTEKAHNLRDRSLEVIRMARAIADRDRSAREADHREDFEEPALLTLGIIYQREGRFAGGAYHPFLRRVDRFGSGTLARSLREREGFASRLLEIDAAVAQIIARLRKRGFASPYLRNLVVARINPVRGVPRGRRPKGAPEPPAMSIGAALTRMAAAARGFDVESVRERDLALVAAVAPPEPG